MDKHSAEDRESCQAGQESGPRLKPSLVPEHDSILLHGFEKNVAQCNRSDLDRNSVQIARVLDHSLRILAGEDTHLVPLRVIFFDPAVCNSYSGGPKGKTQ